MPVGWARSRRLPHSDCDDGINVGLGPWHDFARLKGIVILFLGYFRNVALEGECLRLVSNISGRSTAGGAWPHPPSNLRLGEPGFVTRVHRSRL
jgi:hypothetical protein